MKKIMTRAWDIYRTLTTGTRLEKLSIALKRAWKEVKTMVKKQFEKIAIVAKREDANATNEAHFITFKKWEKAGKSRIYLNDYKGRTIGYLENGNFVLNDSQGNSKQEIAYAIDTFKATYAI